MVEILFGLLLQISIQFFRFRKPSSLSKKLGEKKQTGNQQRQAQEAIRFFYELAGQQAEFKNVLSRITPRYKKVEEIEFGSKPVIRDSSSFGDKYNRKKAINKGQTNKNWQHVYHGLDNEIVGGGQGGVGP